MDIDSRYFTYKYKITEDSNSVKDFIINEIKNKICEFESNRKISICIEFSMIGYSKINLEWIKSVCEYILNERCDIACLIDNGNFKYYLNIKAID